MSEEAAKAAGGKIYTSGSYRLRIHEPNSDIDAICVAPQVCYASCVCVCVSVRVCVVLFVRLFCVRVLSHLSVCSVCGAYYLSYFVRLFCVWCVLFVVFCPSVWSVVRVFVSFVLSCLVVLMSCLCGCIFVCVLACVLVVVAAWYPIP